MPTEQMESREYIITVDGKVIGEFKSGGAIEEGFNISGSKYDESVIVSGYSGDRTFECKFKLKNKTRPLRTLLYGTNNYRRLHGLPAIRGFRK